MKEKVRYLRQQQTDTERLLWSRLRNRQIAGCKFRRQYAIGSYIVDFICVERALVVEIDGGQHADQKVYDAQRTKYLESRGYMVIRFWNNEVLSNLDTVLNVIYEKLKDHPSPLKGEKE